MDLVRQNEKKLIGVDIELLEIDTVPGVACQHKEEKVVWFAVRKTVLPGHFRGEMAERWRDKSDGELVVLSVERKK
ncbi:hypothetical protein GCM10028803_24160 [Larkinella knui]